MSSTRYSKLAPFTLAQRIKLSLEALNFFSPMQYAKVCAEIERQTVPGEIQPLDGGEFLKYLKCTRKLPEADRYHERVRDLLEQLEAAGLLTFKGHGRDVRIGKRYYFMKELTTLQSQGSTWLAHALGSEFLSFAYSEVTLQITGIDKNGDVHAGTALAIAPNWLLTCAHVLNDMVIDEEQSFSGQTHRVVKKLPHASIDVGLIQVEPPVKMLPSMAFRNPVVSETLFTFGFPYIPFTREPALVMQRGEVTSPGVTLIDGRVVFLYSAIARPGNSGGPILASSGQVVGIVTNQLEVQRDVPVLPFYAGISAGTIAAALREIDPSVQLPMEDYE